jgi:hypothetical protein
VQCPRRRAYAVWCARYPATVPRGRSEWPAARQQGLPRARPRAPPLFPFYSVSVNDFVSRSWRVAFISSSATGSCADARLKIHVNLTLSRVCRSYMYFSPSFDRSGPVLRHTRQSTSCVSSSKYLFLISMANLKPVGNFFETGRVSQESPFAQGVLAAAKAGSSRRCLESQDFFVCCRVLPAPFNAECETTPGARYDDCQHVYYCD